MWFQISIYKPNIPNINGVLFSQIPQGLRSHESVVGPTNMLVGNMEIWKTTCGNNNEKNYREKAKSNERQGNFAKEH